MGIKTIVAILLSALAAAAHASDGEGATRRAIARQLSASLTVAGARLDVAGLDPAPRATCRLESASTDARIATSGRVPVRLSGRGCPAWTWARIDVWAPVLVTTRPVRARDGLAAAVTHAERRLVGGAPVAEVADDAVATHALPAGAVLVAADVEPPRPATGTAIKVVVLVGGLAVEQTGALVPCQRDAACAVLPSGKHVRGRLDDGRLIVEAP